MSEQDIRVIKKYQNRRLYDTLESKYIALSDVLDLVRNNIPFEVIDVKTGNDVTRSVLIQIIMEQEASDSPLFTTDVLQEFIRHYDEGSRLLFSDFLDQNLRFFAEQQKSLQKQVEKLSGMKTINTLTDITQNNIDFWREMQSNFLKTAGFPSPKEQKKK